MTNCAKGVDKSCEVRADRDCAIGLATWKWLITLQKQFQGNADGMFPCTVVTGGKRVQILLISSQWQ